MSAKLIFLVGPRASGKTTVGRLLAGRLGLPFADTDQRLQEAEGRPVAVMVAEGGWPGFRRREAGALRDVADALAAGGVVATGGGIVLLPENRALLRRRGTVLYLRATAEILAARLAADPQAAQRPALTGLAPAQEVAQVLREREGLYRDVSDHVLDAGRPAAALAEEAARLLLKR